MIFICYKKNLKALMYLNKQICRNVMSKNHSAFEQNEKSDSGRQFCSAPLEMVGWLLIEITQGKQKTPTNREITSSDAIKLLVGLFLSLGYFLIQGRTRCRSMAACKYQGKYGLKLTGKLHLNSFLS